MKLYYDTTNSATYPQDGEPSWSQISGIIDFPRVRTRMDETGTVIARLRDFEGALKATWESREFTRMEIRDEDNNVIFRGYLDGKKFESKQCTLVIVGISRVLQWTPLTKQYILAEGYVDAVPADDAFPYSDDIDPNGDHGTNEWTPSAGADHYACVAASAENISVTDGDEGAVEDFDLTNVVPAAIECTQIVVKLTGFWDGGARQAAVELYNGAGWEASQNTTFTDSSSTVSLTFAGLSMDDEDMGNARVRITAPDPMNPGDSIIITRITCTCTYTAQNPNSLGLVDTNEDPFDWNPDYWINEKNVGIIIRDNTTGDLETTWSCTALNDNGTGENELGDHTGLSAEGDGFTYRVEEVNEDTWNCIVDLTVGGANVADSNTLQYIEIEYDFKITWTDNVEGSIKLEIDKDGTYEQVAAGYGGGNQTKRVKGTVRLTVDLTDYLHKTGANYDGITGLRFKFFGDYRAGNGTIQLLADYLSVKIGYNADSITPVMVSIDDNGDSWIVNDETDWSTSGVSDGGDAVGDVFRIGENTTQIINDISNLCNVNIRVISTGTKYIAQWFKGNFCLEILKKVCLLEGWHWREDYSAGVFGEIVVSHLNDCEDSGVDLTQDEYDHDWYYEDDTDFYRSVIVFGAAAYRIEHIAIDPAIASPKTKTVYEETITTDAEAQEVAETQLLEWKVKHPSIRIPLTGTYADIKVGTEITLTMSRPTVAEANYPVRAIERERLGHGKIKTIVYAGMGHTPIDEKVANRINRVMYLAQKAHTDRIISTPLGAGTSINWADIIGAEAGAIAACVENAAYGASWNGDSSHAPSQDAVYDQIEAIKTNYNKNEKIGAANKDWITLLCEGATGNTQKYQFTQGYSNVGADDFSYIFGFPLPLQKYDLDGTLKNLYITALKVGLIDADDGDELDRVRIYGWTDFETQVTILDTGAGLDEHDPADYDWDHADTQIGGVYMRLMYYLGIIATNGLDFESSYVRVQYYYG